jgi:hypothetical protein
MNKNKIAFKDMEDMLKSPTLKSPREVLKKLKEIDKKGYAPNGGK